MMPDWVAMGMGMSSRPVPGSEIYYDRTPLPPAPNRDSTDKPSAGNQTAGRAKSDSKSSKR